MIIVMIMHELHITHVSINLEAKDKALEKTLREVISASSSVSKRIASAFVRTKQFD